MKHVLYSWVMLFTASLAVGAWAPTASESCTVSLVLRVNYSVTREAAYNTTLIYNTFSEAKTFITVFVIVTNYLITALWLLFFKD